MQATPNPLENQCLRIGHVSYCINPDCPQRNNISDQDHCQFCDTTLRILEQYSLLRPIRRLDFPSSTEIFEVEDRQGGLKIMRVLKSRAPQLIEALEREATVLQILRHPGIPEAGESSYFTVTPNASSRVLHCLVMEKFPGSTLQEWMATNPPISQVQATDWLRQMTEILDYLHHANFFHQDIKPANIILKPNGRIGLIDFGAVGVVDDIRLAAVSSGFESDDTIDLTPVGTVGYVAPEQANGKAVPQSDFYALGRTFIHLITGTAPHRLPTDPRTGTPLWRDQAPQIRRKLANLIDELVAVFPGDRPKNTQILLRSVEDVVNQRQWFRSPVFIGITTLSLALFGVGVSKAVPFVQSKYYFFQGLQHQRTRPQLAIRDFQRVIKYNPEDADAHANLALSCQLLQDVPCATSNYLKVLKLQPKTWEYHYDFGTLLDEQEEYSAAEQQYSLAIQAGGGLAVDALNNISRLKNLQGEHGRAKTLALEGLKQTDDPLSEASLFKNLGWAEFGLREYSEASGHLLKSLNLDSQRADAYCLLAQIQEKRNNGNQAKGYWQNCLKYDSELPEVRKWRDDVLQRLLE